MPHRTISCNHAALVISQVANSEVQYPSSDDPLPPYHDASLGDALVLEKAGQDQLMQPVSWSTFSHFPVRMFVVTMGPISDIHVLEKACQWRKQVNVNT